METVNDARKADGVNRSVGVAVEIIDDLEDPRAALAFQRFCARMLAAFLCDPKRKSQDELHVVGKGAEVLFRRVSATDRSVHTNTIEGFFSIFKRGMKGIYQHCGQQHLQRYLHEFDFRYTFRTANGYDDAERTAEALKGARGKRLTYRQPN